MKSKFKKLSLISFAIVLTGHTADIIIIGIISFFKKFTGMTPFLLIIFESHLFMLLFFRKNAHLAVKLRLLKDRKIRHILEAEVSEEFGCCAK